MKVQCERCKEIVELVDFTTSDKGIDITCGACEQRYFVAAPAPEPAASPAPAADDSVDTVDCPKCGETQPADLDACRRCGLARDRFEDFEGGVDGIASDSLRALWDACVDDWSDATAHEAFVKAAVVESAYRYAAGSYRQILRDRPGDRMAERQLADVARRAETAILQSARAGKYEDAADEPFKKVTLLLMVLVVLIAMGIVYAMFMQAKGG